MFPTFHCHRRLYIVESNFLRPTLPASSASNNAGTGRKEDSDTVTARRAENTSSRPMGNGDVSCSNLVDAN
ncbi:jg10620 [Pararge aegeria aegeria]|uniref:Jg10620 protein n=1 Tax=Pararge aegeria aegeria TaxID=348720 RepID=A0A8S4RD91_9NEOP|nr:jg10620 [Pararge aegeria aegeria]